MTGRLASIAIGGVRAETVSRERSIRETCFSLPAYAARDRAATQVDAIIANLAPASRGSSSDARVGLEGRSATLAQTATAFGLTGEAATAGTPVDLRRLGCAPRRSPT